MARLLTILPLVSAALISNSAAFAAQVSQTVSVKTPLKIPEATLEPGKYKFTVEDRLQDRAIVRIENSTKSSHYLVLTVPDSKVKGPDSGGLIKYHSPAGATGQTLKAWACPGCAAPLAFVYPKAEAAKITGDSAEPVLAVDTSYDKLPADLSPDDMKVVTLWLLTPKEITPDHKGQGVTGVKWADAHKGTTEMAAATAPKHLPKTAGDTYEWALAGMLLLFTGALVGWKGLGVTVTR